ncbi:hypothetical protein HHI36_017462 [Cryptolaemus montrouzieri]|uniref:Odorant receptor n=1 Tax=Cryptolaemus montrouzieri TaxID=559131 RepID=A0ABD2NNC5_9CUCU
MFQILVQRSFGGNLKFLRWIGLYRTSNFTSRFYKFYGVTFYVLAAWIFPLLAASATILDADADISRVTDTLYLLPQMWILTVKILPFLNKSSEINNLLLKINSEQIRHRLSKHQEIMASCSDECRKLFLFFIASSVTAWIFWMTGPLFVKDMIVPMEILLPFELTKEHALYYPTLSYIGGCVLYGAIANSSMDCLISGLIYHISGQIKILKYNLSHIGENADQTLSHMEETGEEQTNRNYVISTHLQECIEHYDDIIR